MSATQAELEAEVALAKEHVLTIARSYAAGGAALGMFDAARALGEAEKALREATRSRWEVHGYSGGASVTVEAWTLERGKRVIAGFASELEARACAAVLDGLAEREA